MSSSSRITRSATRGTTPARQSKSGRVKQSQTPTSASRGLYSSAYGNDEQVVVGTGLADTESSLSFAQELREKAEAAQKNISRPSVPATSRDSAHVSSSPPRRTRAKSKQRSQTPELIDETLPELGLRHKNGNFDVYYEGGLELREDIPKFLNLVEVSLTILYIILLLLPFVLLFFIGQRYGPAVPALLSSAGSQLAGLFKKLSTPSPNPLTASSAAVSSIFETVPIQSVPHIEVPPAEPTPQSTGSSGGGGGGGLLWRDKSREIDALKAELASVRQKLQLTDAHVEKLNTWKSEEHRINFFSPHQGATIDPQYTGTTYAGDISWYRYLVDSVVAHTPGPWRLNPPIKALTPWRGNGECWCAAPATNGALSLGITLNDPVYPRVIAVDHIAKEFALEPRTAPRVLQFWGLATDRVDENIWAESEKCNKRYQPKGAGWVCLGQLHYDIDSGESTQKLSLARWGVYPPFRVAKVVVHVVENWGREYTCLYQIKMEGVLEN
jgi:hypothetical protein